jgi:hypothetical protein
MNKSFITFNTDTLCYIDNASQLLISSMNGPDQLISSDKNFVDSICSMKMHKKYIIIVTKLYDVYICNNFCESYQMIHLGNYALINYILCIRNEEYFLFLACETEILLFHNNKLTKKYLLPRGEHIRFFSHVQGTFGQTKYSVAVNTGVTYIIDKDLIILATLKNIYIDSALYDYDYYCVDENGRITIYNYAWNYIQMLELHVASIYKHHRLSFVGHNREYYCLHDGLLTLTNHAVSYVNTKQRIVQHNLQEKLITLFSSCYHVSNCSCSHKYTYVIFEGSITIFDEIRQLTLTHAFDFNTAVKITKFNQTSILMIDYNGTALLLEHVIDITNNTVSLRTKYVHPNKIKLQSVTNAKKAIW